MSVYPWQQSQWQLLCAQKQQDTLSHAYLLKGLAGSGKRDFALRYAHFALCLAPVADKSCGHCKSCQLLVGGSHPDLMIVEPEEKSRVIKIDQVRSVISFATKTAQQGGYRVIILNPAEAMNSNSANALLKCLEEPGAKTLILLVSSQSTTMLATINSRCQQLLFPLPSRQQSLQWLGTKLNADESELELLLNVSESQPLTALSLSQGGYLDQRALFLADLGAITKGKKSPVDVAATLIKGDLIEPLACLASVLMDVIKTRELRAYNAQADTPDLKNPDMQVMIGYIAKKAQAEQLFDFLQDVNKQLAALKGFANPNKQLLLEALLIRWLHLTLG